MSHLDLSVPVSRAWRSCLPDDFQKNIPDDAVEIQKDILDWFDGSHSPHDVVTMIGNSDYQFSRTQGMMILCWLADSPAPMTAVIGNSSIADTFNILLKGAISLRLAKGIIVRNADVLRAMDAGLSVNREPALVRPTEVVITNPSPGMGS